MADDDTIQLKSKNLDQIIRAFSGEKIPKIQIGVLGDKGPRKNGEKSNASIGAAHEFGTENLPQRSFLRMPLATQLAKYLEKNGAFDEKTLKEVIKAGSLEAWLKKIAITGEQVVAEGFDTGGFGKWKPSDMRRKQVKQTLVETQQLRNSISSRLK